jgi:N-methylhydantoinase B/oxoprolinase/acetone carboxylase alpha subunit
VRDNINRGAQVRTPGGTRDWMPSKTQNYNGNPDKIRVGQSGGPGYGQTQKGSRPTTSASQSDFNYGPKKQY